MNLVVVAGIALAAVSWALLFAPGPAGFWNRALVAGLVIASYAAIAERHRMVDRLRPTIADMAIGVAVAAALYAVFWTGDRALKLVLPAMARQVADLYAIRATGPRFMPVLLVVVGAGEEVFWRGFVQARAGVLVALIGYAAVHVWERKAALVLAAVVGGAAWAALFAWRGTLVAPVVCHALWDLAVVVWFPFRPPAPPFGQVQPGPGPPEPDQKRGSGLSISRLRLRMPWARGPEGQ